MSRAGNPRSKPPLPRSRYRLAHTQTWTDRPLRAATPGGTPKDTFLGLVRGALRTREEAGEEDTGRHIRIGGPFEGLVLVPSMTAAEQEAAAPGGEAFVPNFHLYRTDTEANTAPNCTLHRLMIQRDGRRWPAVALLTTVHVQEGAELVLDHQSLRAQAGW